MTKFNIKTFVGDEELWDIIELDKKNFSEDNFTSFDTCKEWIDVNPFICTCAYDRDKLCGYIAFMPITKKCYERHIKGEMKDNEIHGKDVLPFVEGQEHYCLLVSLVVDEAYRDGDVLVSLLNSFYKRLKDCERRGIVIKTVIADCVNPRVEEFAKNSGFKQVIKNEHCNIYEGNIL